MKKEKHYMHVLNSPKVVLHGDMDGPDTVPDENRIFLEAFTHCEF